MRTYQAGVIALLALAFTSLGSAASSPSTADTGPSGYSNATSTASGQCSKAEAIAAVKRLGLKDVSPTYPVWKVLCGAFAGAGRQTMVASISGLENVGMLYWAVFRWSGSEWQFLMKQRQAAIVSAAGPDIRETVSIYGFGDSRCCPRGGTRSRVWHWNGSRLVASSWNLSWPKGALMFGFLKTPSGNILCNYGRDKSSAGIGCVVQSGLKPPGRRRRAGCSRDIVVSLRATGSAYTWGSVCPGEDDPETPFVGGDIAWIFGYSEALNVGAIRCTSVVTGLTCRNKSGHGFFLSRERWRSF